MRRLLLTLLGAALVAGALPALGVAPAEALEGPNSFTSSALSTYQTNGIAWSVASAGGLVFVGGSFSSIRPSGAPAGTSEVARADLAVFDGATGAPTSCAPTFTVPATSTSQATVRSLSVSPDRKTLYVGGFFTAVNGVARNHLVALDIATCAVVSGFKPLPNGTVRAIQSTSSTVYYGGSLTSVGGAPRPRAAAASAVGTSSPGALLPWAPSFDLDVRALAIKSDDSVVLAGGSFTSVNSIGSHALAALDPTTGALVHDFGPTFVPVNSVVKDLAVDASGFYTANEGTGGGVFDGRIALNWDYSQRWRDTCLGATQAVVVYNSLLYSGSHAHNCSSMGAFPDGPRNHLLVESVNDPTLLPWFPNTNEGLGEGIGPRDLAVAATPSGDYLWAVGEFTAVNGKGQQGITRFGGAPDTAGPATPTHTVTSPRPRQARVAWRQSLDTDDATLTYQVFRDNGTTPLYTRTAQSWFWTRRQMTFTDKGLVEGSTHTYRVGASDGTTTRYTPWRSVTVASTGPASVSTYSERAQSDGAAFLWRYDEPSDVFVSDATANNYNGTLRGGATYQVTPGALANDPSRALTLRGATTIVYGEQRLPRPTALTVETWLKTTSTVGGKIIGFGDKQVVSSASYDRNLYMADDGRVLFGVASSGIHVLTSPRPLNDGAWHHVVARQGPGGMALFVDGARVARNAVTGSASFSGYWRVGGDNLAGWPSRPTSDFWQGTLDETAVYDAPLSAVTVADHYDLAAGTSTGVADFYGATVNAADPTLQWRLDETTGPGATDVSGSGMPGGYSGGVGFGVGGAVAGTTDPAVALDGSTGLVASTGPSPSPSTFSTEAWVRTTSATGGQVVGFGSAATGSSAVADRRVYLLADGRVAFGVRTSGGPPVVITSTGRYNDGTWHHVVATRGAAGLALYADGARVASSANVSALTSYQGYWRVGGDGFAGWPGAPSSAYLQGRVDEVATYDNQLGAATVAAHYSAGNPAVSDTAAPTMPANLSAGIVAGDARLAWRSALDNRAVTAYDVHRSRTPNFVPDPGTLLATTAATSITDAAVPEGVWYYRVLAHDAAGNLSPVSNQVSLFVTDVTSPTQPGGPSVVTTPSSAELTWTASSDDDAVTEYAVYRSPTAGFTPGGATQVAAVPGDTLSFLDSSLPAGTYYYRVAAKDAAGNLSTPTAEVTAVLTDDVPPTVPGGVTVTVSGATATVSWTASTDPNGGTVTGYDVYRSAMATFVPGAATLVGSTATTSLVDSSVPDGTSYYRVEARDGAGNRSDASPEQSVFIAAAPTVVSLTPVADTYANQGAASTNYGTTSSLTSRGSLGAISYLRFVLPAAPTGKTLTSATLQIRTTTDSFAGSAEAHTVTMADDSWIESGAGSLTWNSRPALSSGSPLGALTGGTVPNTVYPTALDVSALQPLLGTQSTLAVSNAGTDSLWFWSSNHANTGYRPQLALTYS